MPKTVPFKANQFSISTQFKCKYSLSKTFLFQAIQFSQTVLIQKLQFSIKYGVSFIQPIDRALSDATLPGQGGLGSVDNERILRITGTSSSDCFVSYQDTHWDVSYPSAEK